MPWSSAVFAQNSAAPLWVHYPHPKCILLPVSIRDTLGYSIYVPGFQMNLFYSHYFWTGKKIRTRTPFMSSGPHKEQILFWNSVPVSVLRSPFWTWDSLKYLGTKKKKKYLRTIVRLKSRVLGLFPGVGYMFEFSGSSRSEKNQQWGSRPYRRAGLIPFPLHVQPQYPAAPFSATTLLPVLVLSRLVTQFFP